MGSAYRYQSYTWTVHGQPIPAPRLTQASARRPHIPKGYYGFKDRIRAALLDAYPTESMFPRNIVQCAHPFRFEDGRFGKVAIVEYALHMKQAGTGRCTHGDPDNIFKAIADALFEDDRHVLPHCINLTCGVVDPRVEITVLLV